MHTPERTPGRGTDLRLLALAFFAGIAAVYRLPQLPQPWWFLACAPVFYLPWWPRNARYYLAAAVAGVFCLWLHSQWLLSGRLDPALDHHDVSVSGTVVSIPLHGPDRTRFLFEPRDGTSGGMARRLRVSWYRQSVPVRADQCWRFILRVKSPRGLRNPGGFDYAGWLFRNGIGATAYVRSAHRCRGGSEHPLLALRAGLDHRIRRLLPHDGMRAFVLALTLGERGEISDQQWRVLRRTGTSHLVAISGLHVGLVSAAVFLLVRWLWALFPWLANRLAAQRCAALAAASAAAAYALLAGLGLPAQRAFVMVAVVMGALWLGRRAEPSRLLALALLLVLMLNPLAVGSPGFWLSFGAVGWILYAMTGRLRRPKGWRAWWVVQGVLAVALAPMTVYFFGRAPVLAAPVNLVLIPVFTLLVPGFLLGVLVLGIWPWAGALVIRAGLAVLHGLWPAWSMLANVASGSPPLPAPPLTLVVIAVAGLVLILAPRGWPGRITGLIMCLPALLWHPGVPPPGGFRLTVLDVGEGLSAVVRTRGHTLVFDTGPAYPGGFDAGRSVVVPYLRWAGVSRLDTLVLSHGDRDHRGGAPAVLRAYPAHRRLGWGGRPCRAGQHWRWDGVDFLFLHPDSGDWQDNNGSCVLRIRTRGHAVLLTGDIQASAEAHLVATEPGRLRADVLVAPHHGSTTSSTPDFVTTVAPEFVIFPAGWDNRWGFPRPSVVRRYREEGAKIQVTGRAGAILLDVAPGDAPLTPQGWRQTRQRFWSLRGSGNWG